VSLGALALALLGGALVSCRLKSSSRFASLNGARIEKPAEFNARVLAFLEKNGLLKN
jgi:hypothetical protein